MQNLFQVSYHQGVESQNQYWWEELGGVGWEEEEVGCSERGEVREAVLKDSCLSLFNDKFLNHLSTQKNPINPLGGKGLPTPWGIFKLGMLLMKDSRLVWAYSDKVEKEEHEEHRQKPWASWQYHYTAVLIDHTCILIIIIVYYTSTYHILLVLALVH